MARLHGAIERDPAQHERLIARVKEILARVARCAGGARSGSARLCLAVSITPFRPTANTCDRALQDRETPVPTRRGRGWESRWGRAPCCTLGSPEPPSNEVSTHPFSFES